MMVVGGNCRAGAERPEDEFRAREASIEAAPIYPTSPSNGTVPDLGIVVPFYNEERTAGPVAEKLLAALRASGLEFEMALVADGSTDGTKAAIDAVARRDPRVRTTGAPNAEGYGAAILHGMSLLTADVVGWMDGDGQVPPEAVLQIYQAMHDQKASLGMGERVGRKDGRLRAAASRGYNWYMRRSIGLSIHDINAKPKLLERGLLLSIAPRSSDWFIDTELVAGAVLAGAKVVRWPVPFLAREHGSSKVKLSIVAQYARNLRAFRRRVRVQPQARYAPPAGGRKGEPAPSPESTAEAGSR